MITKTNPVQSRLAQIERNLWPNGFRRDVWMIVDCARDKQIFGALLDAFYSRHSCLFSGPLSPELQLAAPYLIQLELDDPKARDFLMQAWGNSWGIFLRCDTTLDALRKHLRTLLIVKDERGSRMMFRYYDPRVLRVYLPTCTSNELRTIFGPIGEVFCEGAEPDTILQFRLERGSLHADATSVEG